MCDFDESERQNFEGCVNEDEEYDEDEKYEDEEYEDED